jgi:hypothetical protein
MPVENHKKPTEALFGSVNPQKPVDEPKQLAREYIRKELIEEWYESFHQDEDFAKNLDQTVSRMRELKLH